MTAAEAHAKINLALVVGPLRDDGKHEVVTLLQRLELADRLELEPAQETSVTGFPEDTLALAALDRLQEAAGAPHGWTLHIDKRIPVAAGLGGGSSDAGTALRLANATLAAPLQPEQLEAIAAGLGADVPFFLREGPQLATGDGSTLTGVELPGDYAVLLAAPPRELKTSTAAVYRAFDDRAGSTGFDARRDALLRTLERVRARGDLAGLPGNDLASSPLADELRASGAFRADVSGAGPTVYALFLDPVDAAAAEARLPAGARSWITRPARGVGRDENAPGEATVRRRR